MLLPDVRMEEYVYEKLDKRLRQRTTPLTEMGQSLIDAGNDFGSHTPYGKASLTLQIIIYAYYI